MSTIIISDIYGNYKKFIKFKKTIKKYNKYLFIGNIINNKYESLKIIKNIISMKNNVKIILGNNELHLLAIFYGASPFIKKDVLNNIYNSKEKDKIIDWLKNQTLAMYYKNFLIVHAGVLPQWDLQKTLNLAKEIKDILNSNKCFNFLKYIYNNYNKKNIIWNDNLSGYNRLLCINNALTRIRYCNSKGLINFKKKKNKKKIIPWFKISWRKTKDINILFGHWSNFKLIKTKNIFCINNGCAWGGKLTTIKIKNQKIIKIF
ncbi:symmetrical bis(5'-nucleosyl)-tetraphosphatase [Candidatus Zinderia endosymbiont of Aphrophora alni]|uniref:symmetrical bis(5'-nucleosyl)-tetraphosphatase n=1 Tax=Candidatus Zinderia endosymbiont of Aphrophora alni TaxID=3077951 RepID=UPI0030D426E8